MVKDCGAPEQPLIGVTVIVAVIGDDAAFVNVKFEIFPVPFAAKPIAVFEFVHVNVAPLTELENVNAPVCSPAQKVLFDGTLTSGAGFTKMFFVIVVVPHSFVTSNVIV